MPVGNLLLTVIKLKGKPKANLRSRKSVEVEKKRKEKAIPLLC
jgi:hypothetical protein